MANKIETVNDLIDVLCKLPKKQRKLPIYTYDIDLDLSTRIIDIEVGIDKKVNLNVE